MIGFERPELALLALPAAWLWWWARDRERGTQVLRLVALACFVAALCSPYLARRSKGRDVVVVVDRSRSMTAEAAASAEELLKLVEEQRGEGDRVGLVTFGARAGVERTPHAEARFDGFTREVDADGSNLAEALEAALELIPDERGGAILLLSDGEARGRDPLPAARRAFAREVRIDVRGYPRPQRSDLAVERLELPERAVQDEPFQFSAFVLSDHERTARYRLTRDGTELFEGERVFQAGRSRLVFRDRVARAGVAGYELEILGVDDRVPENNAARGALRVEGPRAVLVVNHDGQEDSLVLALRRSGLPVAVATPEAAPLTRLGLESFRAVVVENVAAARLGAHMRDLARFVRERAGGLMLTGGRASFGIGGYYLSPLDPLLPVSMELRKEQRKQGMALAIAMDRSGSMGASATGGTKMDLANLGASAAIELLSDLDSVAVLAVDTAADVVQPMARVEDAAALTARVRRIAPGGGGIYVYNALVAAARELDDAPQLSKHITLFADAADSEQPEGCAQLVKQLADAGVSLSVIALGTPGDSDADFLREIAQIGGGEIYFTTSADELPRLFAQDTLTASRATFVDQPAATVTLPELYTLGELAGAQFPVVGGYNLCYLREGATAGVVTADELHAPIFAFGHEGLGRSAAFTGQVGGTYGAEVVAWDGFAAFFVTAARWLVGEEAPLELFPTVLREGREAVVQVELDPESPTAPDASRLEARLGLEDGRTLRRDFERVTERLFEARFPLEQAGVALPTVTLDDERALLLPPVALPYSPEFEPTPDPEAGERLLRRLALESGGAVAPAVTTLFEGPDSSSAWRPISRELYLAALLLVLLEVLFRRLSLWSGVDWSAPLRRRSAKELAAEAEARAAHAASPTRGKGAPSMPQAPAPKETTAAAHSTLADAMAQARSKARRELDR
ncbi:MAG: VWA domain-containing protein [Planctomycetes bacterium]|nr:VWA domain-containing protein [Planctomycetota bacterium]